MIQSLWCQWREFIIWINTCTNVFRDRLTRRDDLVKLSFKIHWSENSRKPSKFAPIWRSNDPFFYHVGTSIHLPHFLRPVREREIKSYNVNNTFHQPNKLLLPRTLSGHYDIDDDDRHHHHYIIRLDECFPSWKILSSTRCPLPSSFLFFFFSFLSCNASCFSSLVSCFKNTRSNTTSGPNKIFHHPFSLLLLYQPLLYSRIRARDFFVFVVQLSEKGVKFIWQVLTCHFSFVPFTVLFLKERL